MNVQKFQRLYRWFESIGQNENNTFMPVHPNDICDVKNSLHDLAEEIQLEYPYFCKELKQLKERLFNGMATVNPFIWGRIYEIMISIKQPFLNSRAEIWNNIHPRIQSVSKSLYENGHYAESAENAFKEINSRVKKLFVLKCSNHKVPDGATAMTTVFSDNVPLIEFGERISESGQNIQKGFMMMLAGAMIGLRNPKAHENLTISEEDAMRQLMFASMLMYKIDDAVEYSGIREKSD